MDHEVTLGHDGSPDGLWAQCSCGWEECLGFEPSPADAVTAERHHLESVGIHA